MSDKGTKAMIELEIRRALNQESQRECLREAYVDDMRQRMAINRAVYAAGYGIDPRPYSQPEPRPYPRPFISPWLIAAAILASGVCVGGTTALLLRMLPVAAPVLPSIQSPAPQSGPQSLQPLEGKITFWLEDEEVKP